MNTTPDELTIQRHDGQGLREQKDELLAVYQEAYAERLHDPFFYPARFWERFERGSSRGGFRLVTGRVEDVLVGFTLGSVLPANSGWWRGFKGDIDPELLRETGTRTFGINELMVRPAWRRRGYAKALSNALLEGLPVERVTLLVRAENTAAYTAYVSWGFSIIGQMQPFDDSPLYEVMMREMKDGRA
jgi:ribosomal protein S18 acetylase RimI-like enzyme